MDQDYELENNNGSSTSADETDRDENVSVDDFIRQLEEKEKDLHITSDTSIIEIAEAFDDNDLPIGLADALAAGKAERAAAATPANEEAVKLEKKVEELTSVIAKMEADQAEMFKNSQRRAKDHEAFKARAERERKETFQKQIANLATLMLPALDNLHRALESAENVPESKEGQFSHFYAGIAIVGEQITEILSKMGMRAIRPVGEEFDPHFHEAVATEETDEFPENTVTAELLRGYVAGEQVIRHSMVKVAKPLKNLPPPPTEEASASDAPPESPAPSDASDEAPNTPVE